jgi:hypothetical protein
LANNNATLYQQASGQHRWFNAPSGFGAGQAISFTQAMTLDASGNLGVGTTSPSARLEVFDTSSAAATSLVQLTGQNNFEFNIQSVTTTNSTVGARYNFAINSSNGEFSWSNSGGERARIDSSGNWLVGTTSGSNHVLSKDRNGFAVSALNPNATPSGVYIGYTTATPNGTGNVFIDCTDSTAQRFAVRSNGGIANYSANNVNLSDQRVKTDIQDAGGYLAKICAIPVRTFKYKDQTDDLLNLGVIAQEVEAVAPELVDASGFGETPDDGVPFKAIYQTDLQYALMKALQELKAEFDAYKASHP